MDDLRMLNERILAHLGVSGPVSEHILQYVTICLGKLKPGATELTGFIPGANKNTLDVTSLNRTYLDFARLVARDIISGHYDGLLVLGVDMAQARALANLNSQQIINMALRWGGLIFTPASVCKHAEELHYKSHPHFATAILAA